MIFFITSMVIGRQVRGDADFAASIYMPLKTISVVHLGYYVIVSHCACAV